MRTKGTVERPCAECGAVFTLPARRVRISQNVYCSIACRGLGCRRSVERTCARCGVAFTAKTYEVGRFCSRACNAAALNSGPRQRLEDRFWSKVDKSGDCWLWTGATMAGGYGKISRGGKGEGVIGAHRVAWELASGVSISDGVEILHTCDTPACVRNDASGVYLVNGVALPRHGHLASGPRSANVQDMVDKGRSGYRVVRGSANGMARITEDDVRRIRARLAAGGASRKALAAELGVSVHVIHDIMRGKTWRHV